MLIRVVCSLYCNGRPAPECAVHQMARPSRVTACWNVYVLGMLGRWREALRNAGGSASAEVRKLSHQSLVIGLVMAIGFSAAGQRWSRLSALIQYIRLALAGPLLRPGNRACRQFGVIAITSAVMPATGDGASRVVAARSGWPKRASYKKPVLGALPPEFKRLGYLKGQAI